MGRRGVTVSKDTRTLKTGVRVSLFAAVVILCVLLDQGVKLWAMDHLVPGKPETLIPHVMDLLLVRNTGAAFSLGAGMGWVFVLIAIAVCAILAVAVVRTQDLPWYLVVLAGLVAGGGLGNLIDRVARGWVCDFFSTTFMDFAVFNVADIFVTVGALLGVVALVLWDSKREAAHGHRGE